MKDCKIKIIIDDSHVTRKVETEIIELIEFYRKSNLIEDMEVKKIYEIHPCCELSNFTITGLCDFSAENLMNKCSILKDIAYKNMLYIKIIAENERLDFKEEYTIKAKKLYKKTKINPDLICESLTNINFI